jgi:hypothetical protein
MLPKYDYLFRNSTPTLFKELKKADQEKIEHAIATRTEDAFLSPIVDNFVYATTRALDFGDFFGKQNKKSLWEHAINKNADYFDFTELIEDKSPDIGLPRYATFNKAHMYTNHNSQHIENSIGLVFDSYPVMDKYEDQHITVLFGIDKKREPRIARLLETYPTRVPVSMGCSIKYSLCTSCNHKVTSEANFCDCLRYSRGQRKHGRKAAELLRGVDFYELSVVNTPACSTAFVIDAVSKIVPGRLLKVASMEKGQEISYVMSNIYRMIKEASTRQEKERLSLQMDQLILKLETIGI